MTGYRRPDDGVVDAAEMVEIGPHRTMRRDTAIALGLWSPTAIFGRVVPPEHETRAEPAEPARAHEVVGGFEGDCSATSCGETLPGADRVNNPSVDAEMPGIARPCRTAGQQTRLQQRDGQREATPAGCAVAPPPAPSTQRKMRSPAVKRSIVEILADSARGSKARR